MKLMNKNILLLPLLIILLSIYAPFTGSQTYIPESWEKSANERQPPEKVLDTIGVTPGMVIGEIGAGGGRYTVHLARRLGDSGKIYANDINESSLSHLRDRCRRSNIGNVETILGEIDDPLFPEKALDLVIMVWVYHHLEKPVALLKNLKASLKPGAPVVILDPSYIRTGEKDSDRPTTRERVEREAREAGYELIRMESFLPEDDIYILKIKDR
ncbi:class I SAM-dependent methyltransferase [Acidobacteriota bacterium]